jgi:hypothetical protein
MPATPHNHGKAAIMVGSGSGGALEFLGYTRNGADVTTEGFWIDVPGDELGGDSGPPIEIQYIAEMARVRLEMTKWDAVVLNKVMKRINLATKGTGILGEPGTFIFMNNYHFRLTVASPTDPRNYYIAIPRAPTQRNMGVRFAMKVMEFDCYANAQGVLWDNNVTGTIPSQAMQSQFSQPAVGPAAAA